MIPLCIHSLRWISLLIACADDSDLYQFSAKVSEGSGSSGLDDFACIWAVPQYAILYEQAVSLWWSLLDRINLREAHINHHIHFGTIATQLQRNCKDTLYHTWADLSRGDTRHNQFEFATYDSRNFSSYDPATLTLGCTRGLMPQQCINAHKSRLKDMKIPIRLLPKLTLCTVLIHALELFL